MHPEPIAVTLQVIQALEDLGIPYVIGGSLAGAAYGVVRSTLDADLLADLGPPHAQPLAQALAGAFYVNQEAVQEAIRSRSSFSVIHLETIFKVDIFISQQRPFDRVRLERRRHLIVAHDPERSAYVSSPEDTILAKLEWYRLGQEVSELQWRDVIGIVQLQGARLELQYLRRWATELGLTDLLERVLLEAAPFGTSNHDDECQG